MQVISTLTDLLERLDLPADTRRRAAAVKPALRLAKASTLAEAPVVATGFAAFDSLLPGGGLARGAVHELLSESCHFLVPAWLARSAMHRDATPRGLAISLQRPWVKPAAEPGWIVWCDESGELYPPALERLGFFLPRLLILRGLSPTDAFWAACESLRCPGVCATIASAGRLSRIQARRLQLAAERGNGIGLLLRPAAAAHWTYAAATRWQVTRAEGSTQAQHFALQLIHAHGGQTGQKVLLEWNRENQQIQAMPPSRAPADSLPAPGAVAHRSPESQIA